MVKKELILEGLDCANCASKIELKCRFNCSTECNACIKRKNKLTGDMPRLFYFNFIFI